MTDTTPLEEFHTDRTYIRVRPTTETITPKQAALAFRRLHTMAQPKETSWFSTSDPATIEILFVAPADSQRVEYLFGIDTADLDGLRRVLSDLFPNTYERTQVETTIVDTLGLATNNTDPEIAGLEFHGTERRAGDWRTRLTPVSEFHEPTAVDTATWPLGAVLETLAETDTPVVVQTLLQPMADWTPQRDERVYDLRLTGDQTIAGQLIRALIQPADPPESPRFEELPLGVRSRIEELEAVDPQHSFAVNTRAIAIDQEESPGSPDAVLTSLTDALGPIGRTGYQVTAKTYQSESQAATTLATDIATRSVRTQTRGRLKLAEIPLLGDHVAATQPKIVADPTSVGSFCLVGGDGLPESARRAIQTKPRDTVPRPLPPQAALDTFRGPGFRLGLAKTTNDELEPGPLAIEPSDQARHIAIVGKTGAGKSSLACYGLVENHAATDGATIIFETKDGTFADDYERAHYARYGSLEDVYRFDAHEQLPAAPVLDIEAELASGLTRTQAVQAVTHRLEAMLRGVMGTEAYEQAFTSSRVIRLTAKALFDRVHGDEQFSLADLQATLSRMQSTEQAPPVSSDHLRRELSDLLSNSQDTFTEIVRGAARRLAELAGHEQLAPQFNYVPGTDGSRPAVDRFDWREKLDEDCVVILDTSALAPEPQRVFTLLTLAQLWTALRRRARERRGDRQTDDPRLVNIHVEEAPDVAAADLLDDYLAKGRGFGAALSLTLQFPGQFEAVDRAVYREVINNTGTVLTGEVSRDQALAESLATSEMPPEQVANRLRALGNYEWLCRLPRGADSSLRPFTLASGPQPPGVPDGPDPLTDAQQATFRAAQLQRRDRTSQYAIPVEDRPLEGTTEHTGDDASASAPATGPDVTDPETAVRTPTLDTTGPLTAVHPDGVTFNSARNAWCCATCENAFGASLEKLLQAVDCHGDREAVPREQIPTVAVDCSLTRAERDQSPYTDAQIAFMQLLYNVRTDRYDREFEFDLVWDDMDQLVAYAGLGEEGLAELITDGLVVQDTQHPQPIYSLTAEGRQTLQVAHREGIVHGDGAGDLSESNFHVMLVEAMRRGFRHQFVSDPSHPGVRVEPYYGVEDGRLDVAVLDDEGDVVVASEAERSNHDALRAVPADFDKMAACTPDQAIWVVPDRSTGHEVIRALNNPADGTPRVPRTYSESSYLPNLSIDEPGLTDIYAIGSFRSKFLASDERSGRGN